MAGAIKGIFFNSILDLIDEKKETELKEEISEKLGKPLKYNGFFNYPVQELNIILEETVKKLYPNKTIEEGIYELGGLTFNTFVKSALGKAVLPYVKKDFKGMSNRIPSWYKQMSDYGSVSVVDLGEKSFKLVFKDFKTYPEYSHGIFQYALKEIGLKGKATLKIQKMKKLGPGDLLTDFECIIELD